MTTHTTRITRQTRGRGTYDITREVNTAVSASGMDDGLCHVFVHHTSASLMLCENADPQVLADLEAWMQRAVPDGDPLFGHTAEGPDDMPAHIRSVITQPGISIPVQGGRCDLGTWQGVFLYEHRHHPHTRRISISVQA